MSDNLLDSLNPVQKEAVIASNANLRVVAGAGSGKTRVLTHRIAWLLSKGVSPFALLAVTFTNKAANEMRSRIGELCQIPAQQMWIGTFHGLSHRLLRTHWQEAKLPQDFQILDSDDQLRLIKRIHKQFNLCETQYPAKQSQWFINKEKEEGRRSKDLNDNHHASKSLHEVYREYERLCEQSGLVDFCELLLRVLELFKGNAELMHHYRQRFQHILVDEFQDTNVIQYDWLKIFKSPHNFIMVVGDDDQSIYSWRGARIENIHQFDQDFSNVKTLRLEQNYRSTQTIIEAANAIIATNNNRLSKELKTDNEKGKAITLYHAYSESDEAYFITSQIEQLKREGFQYSDFAILYRSNAQSRIFEEQLLRAGIPYRIYGGTKFFDRAEVKNALAYLRLITNRSDDAAFERIVNLPVRGIGPITLTKLRTRAKAEQRSLWQVSKDIIKTTEIGPRAINALSTFTALIDQIEEEVKDLALEEQIEKILELSQLWKLYKKDRTEAGLSRVENLEELVSAASQFHIEESDQELSKLALFLSHIALEAGEMQSEESSVSANLMTLHATKGLEFPVVFLAGLEEGLFPHYLSIEETSRLEEERRLCYVGITRAMKRLYLSYAESRRLHGRDMFNKPSRFIEEFPEELIDSIRSEVKVQKISKYKAYRSLKKESFRLNNREELMEGFAMGDQVRHKKFGVGMIVGYEGSGDALRLQIKFKKAGTKWLVASFAKLEPLTK